MLPLIPAVPTLATLIHSETTALTSVNKAYFMAGSDTGAKRPQSSAISQIQGQRTAGHRFTVHEEQLSKPTHSHLWVTDILCCVQIWKMILLDTCGQFKGALRGFCSWYVLLLHYEERVLVYWPMVDWLHISYDAEGRFNQEEHIYATYQSHFSLSQLTVGVSSFS